MASTRTPHVPDSIKAYTKLGLRVYDWLVMHLFLKYVWGCNPDDLVDHYRKHVTSNHADIGVGEPAVAWYIAFSMACESSTTRKTA